MTNEDYISKKEAAKRASCSQRTLNAWMQEGLPFYKVSPKKVLFRWSEVQAFIESKAKATAAH